MLSMHLEFKRYVTREASTARAVSVFFAFGYLMRTLKTFF